MLDAGVLLHGWGLNSVLNGILLHVLHILHMWLRHMSFSPQMPPISDGHDRWLRTRCRMTRTAKHILDKLVMHTGVDAWNLA